MLAKTHLAVGASAWLHFVLIKPVLAPGWALALLPLALLGALLPDIDHPRSTIGQKIPTISRFISSKLGHRGFTHSLFAILICGWGALILHNSRAPAEYEFALMALIVGYISHLAADALTDRGLRPFWPLRFKLVSPVSVTTGGKGERVFCFAATLTAALAAANMGYLMASGYIIATNTEVRYWDYLADLWVLA